ncbi:hypothetical protein JHK82_057102 [Glycine max]|nr:hypothetical protein JHK82_057102 [Glycine max]
MQESLSQVLTKLKDRIHTKEAEVWKEKGELLLKEFSTLMKDKPGMTGTQFQFHNYLRKIIKKKHGTTYELSGVENEGNNPGAIKEPGFGWMTGFLFVVCFVGLFVLIPLRKIMIVDLKLTYPSGLATAVLINGFHTQGDKMAKYRSKYEASRSIFVPVSCGVYLSGSSQG